MPLTLLYRGSGDGCNYDCGYCPFRASRTPSGPAAADHEELARLLDWLRPATDRTVRLFFTPKGEALVLPAYQHAIRTACELDHVQRVAMQTNLSCSLDWLRDFPAPHKLGLWCSYHPSQATQAQFLRRCLALRELGIAFSVGIVGVKENFAAITAMRAALPEDIYLWINAYKHGSDYYRPADIQFLTAIDPLFPLNLHPQPSHGVSCHCGDDVLAVQGDGTVQRCWFCPAPLGNLYTGTWRRDPTPCPNQECRCHIGYVHAPDLPAHAHFGEGILERIPRPGWGQ